MTGVITDRAPSTWAAPPAAAKAVADPISDEACPYCSCCRRRLCNVARARITPCAQVAEHVTGTECPCTSRRGPS